MAYRGVRPTPTVGSLNEGNGISSLDNLVRNLTTPDINFILTAEEELLIVLRTNNISLTLNGGCIGNNCNEIISLSSPFQRKWHSPLKRLFLDTMGIDTDYIPVSLVRQWWDSLTPAQRTSVNSQLSTKLNNMKHGRGDMMENLLSRYPRSIGPGGGEDNVMFDWENSELCVITYIVIICVTYYHIQY